jgi:hypothetical protein
MRRIAVLFLCAAIAAVARGQESEVRESTKFSVLAFGDYYWVLQNHRQELEEKNGFWFRRIYLTADQTLSRTLSARVRLELNQAGDFTSNLTLEPYVKDAWLKWHHSDALDVMVGLSPTPTFDTIEQFWGYRTIEKTPLDLQRIANSRDFGVALLGKLGPGQRIRYHFMAGNGSGTGSETNAGKQAGLLVGFNPVRALTLELYADYDDRAGDTDRRIVQAFAGWKASKGRAGLQFTRQNRERGDGTDFDLDIASVFAVYDFMPRLTGVVRVDRMFDPNPDADRIAYLPMATNAESTLFIAGADFKLHKRLGVIPNVEYVMYGDTGGAELRDDIMPRLTFYYSF